MKFSSLIVVALAANFSFAAPMFCKGTNGYSISFNNNLKKAQIRKNSTPVMFGELICTTVFPRCLPSANCGPIVNCRTAQPVADAGFQAHIRLQLPGMKSLGKISEISIMGSREVSKVSCVRAMN